MNVKQLFNKQLRFENSGHVVSLAVLHRLRYYFVVNLEPLKLFCSFSLRFCLARFWVSVIPTATGLRIGESYQLRSRVQYRLDSNVLLSHAAPTACEMIYTGLVNHRNCRERSQKPLFGNKKDKPQTFRNLSGAQVYEIIFRWRSKLKKQPGIGEGLGVKITKIKKSTIFKH